MSRLLVSLVLVVAACSGGGGGGPPPAPVNPNPAPSFASAVTIDMTGVWEVVDRDIVEANTPETNALQVGAMVSIALNQVFAVELPGLGLPPVLRAEIEAFAGFPVDWYQNGGDGSFLDFGYGWDRLRVPGGGGALRDYVQYGVRVVALGPTMMVGYEAEWTQDFLGQPRFEWLASLILTR